MTTEIGRTRTDGTPVEHRLSYEGFAYHARVVRSSAAPGTVPVVILGGSAQDRYTWVRHEPRLTPTTPVITVDLPGYGSADFLPAGYGLDFLADTVHHMVTSLGHPAVHLMGACYGGNVALRFAQRHPEAVRSMILAGTTLVVPENFKAAVAGWTDMLRQGDRAGYASGMVAAFTAPAELGPVRKRNVMTRMLHRQGMDRTAHELRMDAEHSDRVLRHGVYASGRLPDVPCLAFTGEYDTLTPPSHSRRVAELFPRARFTTVKETDHLSLLERPTEVADLWQRFYTETPFDELDFLNGVERIESPAPLLTSP
ncbi:MULTISPECIES: alpha/beta fold hydrolase [unclassified Streptomyces]|uniref:alpha/beta fold hydrolase n=1 Tax=unclassified Streptomyces TaxID=2593676 RepID=UPI0038256BDC